MGWFYRTITFLHKHRDNESLTAKCLKILHSFNYKYKARSIGVSFPMWDSTTIGHKITFISKNPMELDLFLSQQYFKEMKFLGYFHISEVQNVPSNCDYAVFRRNQAIDKSTPKGQARKIKRLEKRARERGAAYDLSTQNPAYLHTFEHYHSIKEHSSGNGNDFRLNIQMVSTKDASLDGTFTSYGLSNVVDGLQSVPLI